MSSRCGPGLSSRLSGQDALNEYIRHNGSAIFAIPPGFRAGTKDYWGSGLFT